jgi:GT2 family glycosyltransferase
MTATASNPDAVTAARRLPTVLVILVVRDAEGWLRDCLATLADQTYPRVGILAVDDGSADGSHEILVGALGEGRVISHERRIGMARSVADALSSPVAGQADYVLVLHDDAAPDPDAIARLVEATMIPGVERVGVVGAKIVDWDRPRVLRDIGRSADRFGHPFSSLQADELDQGQFDRVLEVLSVDGCAMLVAREVWQELGTFDERLGDDDADLDLCWRARIAGWRVLMTPLARVRHRAVAEHEHPSDGGRSRRYEEDRAAIAATLKNYSRWSLLKVVPLALVLTAVRLLYLTLSRRFEEGWDHLRAWGWNVAHLPGTLSRRRRIQRHRRVGDRSLHRFTESAGLRLPRWFQTAERILEEQRELDTEDEDHPRGIGVRTRSLVAAHPVMVASVLGVLVWAVVVRDLLGPDPLVGGVLPAFPGSSEGFFSELVAATRSTGLGGSLAASPALAPLGAVSWATFGSTAIAQKVLLAAGPVLAAVLLYRAAVRRTGEPGASVVAAAAYVASALVLWSYSEGRLALLAAIAVLPPLVERLEVAFAGERPFDSRRRLAAGIAVTLAVGVAVEPGIALAFVLVTGIQILFGRARLRGMAVAGAAAVGAAVLLFPFLPTVLAGGGAAFGSTIGTTDLADLARFALGPGPGTWEIAAFLPIAAALGLTLARGEHRAPAWRATSVVVAALGLAWCSAAGWLPVPIANAPVYAAVAAAGAAFVLAHGVASIAGGLGREAFGFRQVGAVALVGVLAGGVTLQSIAAMTGRSAVGGPDRVAAAWAVIDGATRGAYRVLWVGGPSGAPFPAPGGDPVGVIEAGEASFRYGLTDRAGTQMIDVGRPLAGPGRDALERVLGEIVAGGTAHGGALLASFGVRFVMAADGDVPAAVAERFSAQIDLDVVPATGLAIARNAVALPPAVELGADDALREVVDADDLATIQRLQPRRGIALRRVEGGWDGRAADSDLLLLSTEFDPAWAVEGSPMPPRRSFGWATSFEAEQVGGVRVRYGEQLPRTLSIVLLAVVWAAALWMTRRPVAR